MMEEKVLSRSVRLMFGGLAVGMGFLVQPVLAQEDSQIERIDITGSAIKRIAREGALPVQILNRADIARSGAISVTELIQKLPVMQGFTELSTSVGGGGGGASTASIHNVGENRTLVLLNGRRLPTQGLQTLTGAGAAIDLNTIPLAAIERVEVLTDGASALYGSDAIGGVVNFILRHDFTGAEVTAGYKAPKNGGIESSVSFTAGFGDFEKDGYNALLSFGHDERTALKALDRDFAKTGVVNFTQNGRPYQFNNLSYYSVPANVYLVDAAASGTNPYLLTHPGTCPALHTLVDTDCKFDYAATLEIYPEMKRDTLLLSAQKKITGDHTLFADFTYGKSTVVARIAAPSVDILISPSSPFYSTAIDAGAQNDEDVIVSWRGSEVGNRTTEYGNEAYQFAVGMKGVLSGWDYQASYTRARSKSTESHLAGWLLRNELEAALDAGVFNPFAELGNQTPEGNAALASMKHVGQYNVGTAKLDMMDLKMSRSLAKLPDGDVMLGAGASISREQNIFNPSVISQGVVNGIAGDDGQNVPFDLRRKSYGAFTELLVPVMKNLDLTGALRADKYSDFDETINGKVSARWTPVSSLLIRGSIGTGFRAPTAPQASDIRQLYGVTGGFYSCPFDATDPLLVSANCLPPDSQWNVFVAGNPNLQPEKSAQWTLGMRIDPSKDLSLGFDIWNVNIKNKIGLLSEEVVMPDPESYRKNFTTFVNPLTQQTYLALFLPNENLGDSVTRGIDLDGKIRFNTPIGRVISAASGTYMLKNDYQRIKGGAYFSDLGQYNDENVTFRFIGRLMNTLASGPFEHSLSVNYKSGYTDKVRTITDMTTLADIDAFTRKVSSYTTWDWQTNYAYSKSFSVNLGVVNLMNRQPPLSIQDSAGHQLGYDGRYADPMGRSLYINIVGKF